jgi:hypothetical protein
MEESQVDLRVASRDLAQAIIEERIPPNVEAEELLAPAPELQQAAHPWRQQVDHGIRSVLGWHGSHAEFGITISDRVHFPGIKRVQVRKPHLSELFRRVPGRDNGNLLIELAFRHRIKVIAVIVREDEQVEWRKVLWSARRSISRRV